MVQCLIKHRDNFTLPISNFLKKLEVLFALYIKDQNYVHLPPFSTDSQYQHCNYVKFAALSQIKYVDKAQIICFHFMLFAQKVHKNNIFSIQKEII